MHILSHCAFEVCNLVAAAAALKSKVRPREKYFSMIGWPFLVADDDRLERRSEIQFYNYPQPHTCTFQALVTSILLLIK